MAGVPSALAESLRDRYVLERELGRGGMATVYLAQDLKHKRPVALKVLHPDLAATLGPERFLREVQLTARLQHPHILPVHDSGEAAGQLWYTMPYVEGESLRDRLTREKQLPLDDAVQIARNVLAALAHAHSHGVIHRDIKPGNILLESGEAVVADFGIARAISVAGAEHLTQTGMAVGTPAYMSPEQAAGGSELDGRSDLYSLGCVLYEMLAGEPPYTGPTPQAVLAKRFLEPVPHLRTLRESVPDAVEQAVTTALAKVPADRFATAHQFAQALVPASLATPAPVLARPRARRGTRWPVAGLGLALAAGAGGLLWHWSHSGAGGTGATGPKMLAVLPFENLGRPEDEYFADGMTDEVRGKLSTLTGLELIARASSTPYKKTAKTPQQIAQELGVQYLLTATVRWEKLSGGVSTVHVSPELVQVRSGSTPTTKWQQSFDAELRDVFRVQADIASRVAQALALALGAGAERQLADRPTQNLAAYDAFLHGEEASQGMWADAPSLRRAVAYYEEAVALDSSFVQAWAQRSRALANLYSTTPTPVDAEASHRAAVRALALAPNNPDGHLALGDYYKYVLRDNLRSLEQYAQGLRLAPGNAELLSAMAPDEWGLGHWETALEHLQQAERLDPQSISTARRLGSSFVWLRRYREAIPIYDHGLALAPANLQLLEDKAMVFLAQGDLAGAQAVLRAAPREIAPTALVAFIATVFDLMWVLDDAQQALLLRLTPSAFDGDRAQWGIVFAQTYALRGDSGRARLYADSARIAFEKHLWAAPNDAQQHVLLGLSLAYLGRKADAIREGRRGVALIPITTDAVVGPYFQQQLVRIYIQVHEPEKALDQLEPLLKMPYFLSPGWLKSDPNFDPLRGNPRFERLVNGT